MAAAAPFFVANNPTFNSKFNVSMLVFSGGDDFGWNSSPLFHPLHLNLNVEWYKAKHLASYL